MIKIFAVGLVLGALLITYTTWASTIKVTNGSFITIQNTNVTLEGDLQVDRESSLILNSGRLVLNGNWKTQGGFSSTGKVIFQGEETQTVDMNLESNTFHDLEINTKRLDLNSSVGVSGTLTLNTGLVYLGTHDMTFEGEGKPANVSSESYLVTDSTGSVYYSDLDSGEHLFPIGPNQYAYLPITVSNQNESSHLGVRLADSLSPRTLVNYSVPVTWYLDEVSGLGIFNLSATWQSSWENVLFSREQQNVQAAVIHADSSEAVYDIAGIEESDGLVSVNVSGLENVDQIIFGNHPDFEADVATETTTLVVTSSTIVSSPTTTIPHVDVLIPEDSDSVELAVNFNGNTDLQTVINLPETAQTEFTEGLQTENCADDESAIAFSGVYSPESFSNSNIEEASLSIQCDLYLKSSTVVEEDTDLSEATTVLTLPAGTQANVTYTAALSFEAPTINMNGEETNVSVTQNSEGQVEVAFVMSDSTGTGDSQEKILLPKLESGSQFEIVNLEDSVSLIAQMPLVFSENETSRQVAQTEPTSKTYYMGRDLETQMAVYIEALEPNTQLEIERTLGDSETQITIASGRVQLWMGTEAGDILDAGMEFWVVNQSIELKLSAGNHLLTFPINESISSSDLEIKALAAHSVWKWEPDSEVWAGFSPQLSTARQMAETMEIPAIAQTLEVGQGVWLFTSTDVQITLHDAPEGTLPRINQFQQEGWTLVGNPTQNPLSIEDFVGEQSFQSLWRIQDNQWKAYSLYNELVQEIENSSIPLILATDTLNSGEAVWLDLGTDAKEQVLRTPPNYQ